MTVQLNFGRDVQGMNAYAPAPSDIIYSATLTSGSVEPITVPSSNENWIAVFSYEPGADIFVAVNATAAAPAGGTFASTTSFLLPAQYKLKAADVISLFNNSSTSQDVTVALYAVP